MAIVDIKKIIAKMTLPLGFTIRRVTPLRRFQFFQEKKPTPVYIEFVGGPAVGKTTLYRQLNKKPLVEWIDPKHFSTMHYDKVNVKLQDPKSFYQYLASWRINHLASARSLLQPTDRLEGCSSSYNVLREDALIHVYNKKDLILSEEGIFQFFSGGIGSLRDDDRESFELLMQRRAIVYCVASVEAIASRIEKRRQSGGTNWYGHNTSTHEELLRVIQQTLNEKDALISILKEYIPVLEIDTENSLRDNERKIRTFIRAVVKTVKL